MKSKFDRVSGRVLWQQSVTGVGADMGRWHEEQGVRAAGGARDAVGRGRGCSEPWSRAESSLGLTHTRALEHQALHGICT